MLVGILFDFSHSQLSPAVVLARIWFARVCHSIG